MRWFLILILTYGSIGYGVYKYYQYSNAKIDTLTTDNLLLETVNEEKEEIILRLKKAEEFNQKATLALMIRLREAEKYQDQLVNTLQRHDLTKLATQKPGLITKRLNDATEQIFKDLESITADQ